MPSISGSHSGFRPFLALGISILCFFAFQHYRGILHGLDFSHTSLQDTGGINVATPARSVADPLVKRVAIPFGDATACNFSSPPGPETTTHPDHPDLVRRSDWTLTYSNAKCKGERLRDRINSASAGGRVWPYSAMTTNGWTVTEPGLQELPAALISAMESYGLGTTGTENRQRNANLDHPFINDAGETVENDCGYYQNAYNVESGAIIAINNAAPAYCANYGVDPPLTGAALLAKLPPLNRWSDVVWTLWQDTAGKALAPSLQYIFRDNVVNDDSKHIMDVVMGIPSPDPGHLSAPFPGKTFDVDSDDGAALLGTPHGNGIAWLLIDHADTLGKRHVKITIYTGVDEPTGRNQYFLIFELQ